MNILLTSCGRRTYLVDYFRKALNGEGHVYASNSEISPALVRADDFAVTPLIYSEEYIPFLLDFCRKNSVDFLVPLFDVDLPVLSRNREPFRREGITVAVSSPEVIEACNDKYSMSVKLWKSGIRCPETMLSVEEAQLKLDTFSVQYPLMVKPRYGMGSIGVDTAENAEELSVLYEKCARKISSSYLKYESAVSPGETVILQQKISGCEYGMDVVNDFEGNLAAVFLRKKAAMRAGETDEAITLGLRDPEYETLIKLGEQISAAFHHLGTMDVDVMMDPENKVPYVIDMNARFGGGYPFSHAAGANLPLAYVSWAAGRQAPENCFHVLSGVRSYKDIEIFKY